MKVRPIAWLNENHHAAGALAALISPLVIGVIGWMVNNTMQQRTRETEALRIAVEILRDTLSTELRYWAADVFRRTSPVEVDSGLYAQLRSGEASLPDPNYPVEVRTNFSQVLRLRLIRALDGYPILDTDITLLRSDPTTWYVRVVPMPRLAGEHPPAGIFEYREDFDPTRGMDDDYVNVLVNRMAARVKAYFWSVGYVTPR